MKLSFAHAEERHNKTSLSSRFHRKRFSHNVETTLLESQRPNTTSFGRTQNISNYHNLEMAENFLTITFREEMNNYMKKRIKNFNPLTL